MQRHQPDPRDEVGRWARQFIPAGGSIGTFELLTRLSTGIKQGFRYRLREAKGIQPPVETLRKPHHINDHELHVTASIGIVTFPDDGSDAETLIKNADLAMLHAKETGRDRVSVISERSEHYSARTAFSERIRKALREDDFLLYAQPIVALPSRDVAAYELLLRIPGVAGVTSPSAFLEVA